jgi:hypothetical protein
MGVVFTPDVAPPPSEVAVAPFVVLAPEEVVVPTLELRAFQAK